MTKTSTIDNILQAIIVALGPISTALGIYLGMFLGFALKQVFDAFQSSSTISAIKYTYSLVEQYLDDLIGECSALSNEFLMLSFIVITIFAFFLFLLQLSKPYIGKDNYPFVVLLLLVIGAWFFEPLMMITSSIQNPQSIHTIEANIPPSDLATLSYNVSHLDRYRWFLRAYLVGFKLVIFVTLLLFSSLTSFKMNKLNTYKSLALRFSLMAIPLIASSALNTYFPVPFPVEYKKGVLYNAYVGWPVPAFFQRVHIYIERASWIWCGTSIFWRELNSITLLLYTRLKSALSSFFRY